MGRESGKTYPLIIAEAGVNHNGDIEMALEMVRHAARAGADYIKFQTFKASSLVTRTAPKAAYQRKNDDAPSQYEMLERLELTAADFELIAQECRARGIGFMSTPFDIESADMLAAIGQDYWKIPSGELTNLPLLRHLATLGGKMILSTGMATLAEVEETLKALEGCGVNRKDVALLHCTTAYPTPPEDVNLAAMETLRTLGAGTVGYSDHTRGITVPIAAAALGAGIIEKHFTLDRSLPGPDHSASLAPDELEAMVRAVHETVTAIGTPEKAPVAVERDNAAVARKSIVAACHIAAGELLGEHNLTTKRPGTGLSPMLWDKVVGRAATHAYLPDQPIDEDI